jgi:predicted NUDIX family NTP pyrophosphohydrolase
MEWPPRSGQRRSFPEIDRLGWFRLPEAMNKIIAYQQPLLAALKAQLENSTATGSEGPIEVK